MSSVVVSACGGYIVIQVGNLPDYNIEVGRCDTNEKILAWVYHLTEKTWMTTGIIREFIIVARSHNKLDFAHV